jgi:hypothetical protein
MGAIGSRKSTAPNHFSEAAYMGINSKGRLYVGDSQVARVTELIPPAQTTAGEGGAAGGNKAQHARGLSVTGEIASLPTTGGHGTGRCPQR